MADLIERLDIDSERLKLSKRSDLLLISGDVHEAAAEIASLRTALATEREAREKAEAALAIEVKGSAEAYKLYLAAESSLAEARRLLKSALHHAETEGDDTLVTVIRRFLSQEPSDGR